MNKEAYVEVRSKDGIGTELRKPSLFEVRMGLYHYKILGNCIHNLVYYKSEFIYDEQYCRICNQFLDLI